MKRFTSDEEQEIIRLHTNSTPQMIADHLQRARSSVEKKMTCMGLPFFYERRPFKVWEETFIRKNLGAPRKTLATRLNRSVGTVQEKIADLYKLRAIKPNKRKRRAGRGKSKRTKNKAA